MLVPLCGTKFLEVNRLVHLLLHILFGMLTTMANRTSMTGRLASLQDGQPLLSNNTQEIQLFVDTKLILVIIEMKLTNSPSINK